MPQLVKGGKVAYGWSKVSKTCRIAVPQPALEDYQLHEAQRLILLPGSRTSGGFALGSHGLVSKSPVGVRAIVGQMPGEIDSPEGEVITIHGRRHCWVRLRDGGIQLSPQALSSYGIKPGGRLLVVRGSSLAVAFVVKGPIVEEAAKHPELEVYTA